MESKMWKLFILCAILSAPLKVKSSEDVTGSHTIQGSVHSVDKKRQELIPYPRMGRSSSRKFDRLNAFEILQKEMAEKSKENQRFLSAHKEQEKDTHTDDDGFQDLDYDISEYLLPYPRPGRQLNLEDLDSSSMEQENMLPYPRFGKSLSNQNINRELFEDDLHVKRKEIKDKEIDLDTLGQFLTPYPRIGRTGLQNDASVMLYSKFNNSDEHLIPYPRLGRSDDFITPYPRMGRNDEYLTPYPRLGRSDEFMTPYPRIGRSDEYLTPYPRLGRSDEFMTPYPRIGRNDEYLTPYPRLGRSDEFMTPYPRMGRNDEYLTPYPRMGRNDEYLTPYPRLGRSDEFMTPYPRIGRSDEYLTPYPRLGRNDEFMTPYPRIGKRNSIDALSKYPPTGRAPTDSSNGNGDYVLPYPRPGKRNSEDIMIPYPRMGKRISEDTVLPYPRLGRSQKSSQSILVDDYDQDLPYITPYPRPGKSLFTQNSDLNFKNNFLNSLNHQVSNRWQHMRAERSKGEKIKRNSTDSDEEEGNTMIPNFRFGRSANNNIQIRRKRNSDSNAENQILLPYPRLGRSPKFSALARSAQSNFHTVDDVLNNDQDSNSRETSLHHIPYKTIKFADQAEYFKFRKRDNREKLLKAKTHKIASKKPNNEEEQSFNEFYMLPYPRPGRTST